MSGEKENKAEEIKSQQPESDPDQAPETDILLNVIGERQKRASEKDAGEKAIRKVIEKRKKKALMGKAENADQNNHHFRHTLSLVKTFTGIF